MDEKEFAVIREISNHHYPTQRTIAKNLGISLGLTNLIIRRLIKKGYLKVSQLNARKIEYILTPQGFAEKAKKSYYFTLKTINNLKTLKQKIQEIILSNYKQGKRKFAIQGNTELATLVEISFRDLNLEGLEYFRENNELSNDNDLIILNTEGDSLVKDKVSSHRINLIQCLAESGIE